MPAPVASTVERARPRLEVLAILLGAACLPARAGAQGPVIPPAGAAVVGEVCGVGADALAGCRLAGVQIDEDHAVARYACAAGEVTVRVTHPDVAPGQVSTEHFAFAAAPDAPELLAALAARAEGAESPWIRPERAPPRSPSTRPSQARLPGASPRTYGLGVLGSTALFAIAYLAWRRRS